MKTEHLAVALATNTQHRRSYKMTTWEIREGLIGDILIKIEDGIESFVPMAEDNSDYQRYLNPEAEQSTPNLAP